jgi:hypothetical protein
MIVNDGGAAWRNSASFEDRADGDGPACGEELIEGPHGELCTLLPHALPMNGCRVCYSFCRYSLPGPMCGDDGLWYADALTRTNPL